MIMDDPQLQAILEQFTPEYQAMVTGLGPALLAQSFAETFQLTEKEQTVLENSFRMYLMGMHSTSEWIQFITDFTSFDKTTAEIVVKQMQTHIADDLKLQIEEFRTGPDTFTDTVEEEPIPTSTHQPMHFQDKPAGSLASIRTMQSDASAQSSQPTTRQTRQTNDTPDYTTISQEDLLQRKEPKNPSGTDSTAAPRWKSETTDSL